MLLRREHLTALVVAVSLAASAQPIHAQWNVNGVALDTAPGGAYPAPSKYVMVTDGDHGAIVTWMDSRRGNLSGDYDIYAQHVLKSGVVDPAWTTANGNPDGTPVCTAVGDQWWPRIATDGSGGTFVIWQDDRAMIAGAVYAQHVLASGVVDPAWPADGLLLDSAGGNGQEYPDIISDADHGAIVTWASFLDGVGMLIYVQHVLDLGVTDPTWPAHPLLCSGAGGVSQKMVTDGDHGAIVTWLGRGRAMYAQHVLKSGVVDSVWTAANGNADGTPLLGVGAQFYPTIVTDGSGGAIVTWEDNIDPNNWPSPNGFRVAVQRVLASGVVDPAWTAANGNAYGTALCMTGQAAYYPAIETDGDHGAIVTWTDSRSGVVDVYAQRVNSAGAVQWIAGGAPLSTAADGKFSPQIATDGSGGAFITWDDAPYGLVYAQHVLASGVDPAWPTNGRGLCTAASTQQYPIIVTDELGGAIVAWDDLRYGIDGISQNSAIYAQRVFGSGVVTAVATGGPSYSFAVHAPHPNPANPQATISFDLASPQPVSVRVYDVAGRLVRTLAAGGELGTGSHSLMWNGASDSGALAHAGIYFIRVSAGSAVQTRRVAIIR
jgi:hypothetical protein